MERVKAEYFNAIDKATGEVKEVQFIPPAPSCGNGGIITIPRFAGDWGIYRIVFFDKGLSVNVVA